MFLDSWMAQDLTALDNLEKSRSVASRALSIIFEEFESRHGNRYGNRYGNRLEIGSGLGYLQRNWPKFERSCVQLDSQIAFLDEARRRNSYGSYQLGSAYELPFADSSFDMVLGLSSFDVLSDLKTAVKEVYRVLRRGGMFVHFLDFFPDGRVIKADFEKKRILFLMHRQASKPIFSNTHYELSYLSSERLPSFLAEVGMSNEEMAALPQISGDFALPTFLKNRRAEEDVTKQCLDYFEMFSQYSTTLNTPAYFGRKLYDNLKNNFSGVVEERLQASFLGPKTPFQKKHYPDVGYFEKELGDYTFEVTPLQQRFYGLSPRKQKIFSLFEPACLEIAALQCLRAYKD